MTGKDIALTTGGILATMALAYMFYRLQQRDAAAAAASSASSADQAQADAYNTQQLYAESLSSLATPVITGTTTNIPAAVDTSAAVSNQGFSYDSTDEQNLLSQIVAAFPATQAATTSPQALDLLSIPTIGSGVAQSSLAGIPVTAQEAQAQAILTATPDVPTYTPPPTNGGGPGPGEQACPMIMGPGITPCGGLGGGGNSIPVSIGIGSSSYPPSMYSSPLVSSHPVTPHPITETGQ